MPPAGWKKDGSGVVGVAKAKGMGKAKAGAKGSAKAKLARMRAALKAAQKAAAEEAAEQAAAAASMEGQPGEGVVAIPAPKAKSKAAAFKKKVLGELGEQSVAEAMAEAKKKMQLADAAVAEAEATETALANQAAEAKLEYDKASQDAQNAMATEMEMARTYKAVWDQRAEVESKVDECRNDLYQAQKKVAMLEVLAVNHAKMKELEEKKAAAMRMAEEARRSMLEQKQREKEALEQTRKLLAEQKADLKGGKGGARGIKARKSVHPDEADTLPATLADGSQAADID